MGLLTTSYRWLLDVLQKEGSVEVNIIKKLQTARSTCCCCIFRKLLFHCKDWTIDASIYK